MKIKKMIEELDQEDYVIKDIGGDGNCLFDLFLTSFMVFFCLLRNLAVS